MTIQIEYKNGINKLLKEYASIIEKEIEIGIEWRKKIDGNKLSDEDHEILLKDICTQLLVQGRGAKGVGTQLNSIEKIIGRWSIENIERNLSQLGMSDRKCKKLKEILRYLKDNSISRWIVGLHEGNSHIPDMGPKSNDDFLKTHGFYEHIPVDRHTQRFLFRTGIIHWYLKKNDEDVLTLFVGAYEQKYKLFQKIIAEFCRTLCNNIYLQSQNGKLNLAENVGILDIVIW
jgi:endonuclease III